MYQVKWTVFTKFYRLWVLSVAIIALLFIPLGFSEEPVSASEGLTGLSLLEHTVFAQTFETEDFEARVARLENTVFGDVQPGDINGRQEKLTTVILAAQPLPPSSPEEKPPVTLDQPVSSDATEYPVVVALERKIMGRDFIYSPLNARLNRLERKVFGRTFDKLAFSDRVDQLLDKYPDVQQSLVVNSAPSDSSGSVLSSLPDHSSQFVGGSDTYKKLTILEKNLFNETFDEELITERLDRLEKKAYGYSLSGQAVSTRLNRLVNGYASGYTQRPKYTAPRSAYVEKETIQATSQPNNPSSSSSISNTSSNISVGSSAISDNTYRYSPEMVEMLPPDVQRQYYQKNGYSGLPSSGSTVVQNSSTVVLPNGSATRQSMATAGGMVSQSTQYSGFQTYSDPTGMNRGNTMTYQNYSVNPNGSMTQSRTQVFTAPGSTLTVTKEKYIPSQMPGYSGNPSILHHLTQLEANVYGRDFSGDTVPKRLSRLEQVLTGKTYQDFTDVERLNNLLKVYQYQSLARYMGQPLPAHQTPAQGVKLKIPLN